MPILTRKIKTLPSATVLSDTDIFINEDETTTQKVTFRQLIDFICNHTIIKNAFTSKSDFNSHVQNTTIHITSTERTNWNDANSKKHTHSNKDVLDGITAEKIENWDALVDSSGTSHTHTNKAVLDKITQDNYDRWCTMEILSSSEPSQQVTDGHWLQPYT